MNRTAGWMKRNNRRKHLRLPRLKMDRGGACERCGYSKTLVALSFHHRDRDDKSEGLSRMAQRNARISEMRAEIKKCDLLCLNCHAEVEEEWRKAQGQKVERR